MKLLALSLLPCAAALSSEGQHAFDVIKGSLRVKNASKETYASCDMSSSETCQIAQMDTTRSTLVNPGGETRCIFSNTGPYTFQVWPGAKDKLLLYFQVRTDFFSTQATHTQDERPKAEKQRKCFFSFLRVAAPAGTS